MKHLLTIHESDVFTEKKAADCTISKLRNAARAVVLGANNRVGLLRANTYNYHKLPGGGVEAGESIKTALNRELLEEIGCRADIMAEIGKIVEYRYKWGMKQISHCYLARQIGEPRATNFTQSEIDEGFEVVWVDGIDDAIRLLEQDEPKNYDGLFIQRRDIQLLRAAQQLMASGIIIL